MMPSSNGSHASEPLIGGLLRFSGNRERSNSERRGSTGYTDIRRAHLSVFQFPSPDGVTPSVLATRANVTKQSMNYLLGELKTGATSNVDKLRPTEDLARFSSPREESASWRP